MSVYDRRFFIEHYYSRNKEVLKKTRNTLKTDKNKVTSAIVVHEVNIGKGGKRAGRT
jgi:hypothetical protein